ncbi:glycosyltransferase [Billgrantia kenyensis]|uniref:Glycosyltransferase n=1 Tax=Billgrantia kenyensis TaxID=321266 RepID=A0A7W0ADF8_9GAMM|nr:glycosyltransferase [Halomonas kenyensis]MBA2779003.1 glycosyltransferase [Halomonas kenyensis]MCG6662930.1 glycosyltransferase [Halomonas kenyensis]
MNCKRFAFVISDFYGGGAQKVFLNTAEELRLRGHTVKILTLRERIEHEIPPKLEIVNLAVINRATKALTNVLVEKAQAHVIGKALRSFQPDVVISCSCDRITRHLQGFNLYFWVHANSIDAATDAKQRQKLIAKNRNIYLERRLIVVSEGIKQALVNHVGLKAENIQVIYNPFDQALIAEKAKEPIAAPHADYFIHVGSFEYRKRHDRLLKAYHASGSQSPLVLMGKGKPADEARLLGLIDELGLAERVTILPFQTNPYPFIAQAKALLLTSDQEGLPTVLIEALLLHTPVISVDCPSGPSEILTDELAPYLTDMNDAEALASAIRQMDDAPLGIETKHYKRFLSTTVIPQFERL